MGNVENVSVLLVDDEPAALESLIRALRTRFGQSYRFHSSSNPEDALEAQARERPEVAIIDLLLSRGAGVASGCGLIKALRERDSSLRIIVLTGHGTLENGVRAMALGAASFIEKPADITHLAALVSDGVVQATLRRELDNLRRAAGFGGVPLIGSSTSLRELKEELRFAASSRQPVLILGETGSGKGVCARAIHALSAGPDAPFVRYQPNYAGADLVNSELFGHCKGAFTGAQSERRGLLEEASGGSLFLDEVDELPAETQVTLLGALQEKVFRRVGSGREQRCDFRLICATNREPDRCVENGRLRLDLYHRIAHLVIRVPCLREHREDIPELARHFLWRLREREGARVYDFSDEALAMLVGAEWPGNVRQLQAAVEEGVYRAQFRESMLVDAADLRRIAPGDRMAAQGRGGFHSRVASFKVGLVQEALTLCHGNQVRAAKHLGIDRSSLRRILEGGNDFSLPAR